MSALTNAGKLAYLEYLKASTLHFAFGEGTSSWGTNAAVTKAMPSNGEIVLDHQFVSSVVLLNVTQDNAVGVQGTPEDQLDFFVDFNGGVIHINPAFADEDDELSIQYNHGFQEENPAATALIAEKIRKVCLVKSFVEVNPNGPILVNGVRYSETEEATRHLYLQAWLEPNEYSNGVVRELGIFLNPTLAEGTPEGQLALDPEDDIESPGTLILVANYPTIVRNAATRSRFHHIIALPVF